MSGKVQVLSPSTPTVHPKTKHNVLVKCDQCGEQFTREHSQVSRQHACAGINIANQPSTTAPPVRLECKLLHPNAVVPNRKRHTDVGLDVTAVESTVVPKNGRATINTGLAISVHAGWYMTVEGRSGLGMKGIVPFRGIIDSTFSGRLVVQLHNYSDEDYSVTAGDRVAQLILHKQYDGDITVIDEFGPEYSQRGEAGFGSSGT